VAKRSCANPDDNQSSTDPYTHNPAAA
jgi:hypothetical protein